MCHHNFVSSKTKNNFMKSIKSLAALVIALVFSASVSATEINDGNKVNAKKVLVKDVSASEMKSLNAASFNEVNRPALTINTVAVNPEIVDGKISIAFTSAKGSIAIQLRDGLGNDIYTEYINGFSGSYNNEMAVPYAGVYFLQITQKGKVYYKKLILQ
jgi:hypothetical protein